MILIIFERPIVSIVSLITKGMSYLSQRLISYLKKEEFKLKADENDEVIDAPDFYHEINF